MRLTRKSDGLDEDEWMRRVTKLFNERQTLFPIEYKQMKRLYDQDYSIDEALLKDLTKGHMDAFMELHIKHELGEFTTTFRTDEQAKQFFRKFPEIRRELTL